jgi:hypothetical protein
MPVRRLTIRSNDTALCGSMVLSGSSAAVRVWAEAATGASATAEAAEVRRERRLMPLHSWPRSLALCVFVVTFHLVFGPGGAHAAVMPTVIGNYPANESRRRKVPAFDQGEDRHGTRMPQSPFGLMKSWSRRCNRSSSPKAPVSGPLS